MTSTIVNFSKKKPITNLINWSQEFIIGIQEIDVQHKAQMDMINEIHMSIMQGKEENHSQSLINQFCKLCHNHFMIEESMMRIFNFSGYEDHTLHHDILIRQLVNLRNQLKSKEQLFNIDVSRFLKKWLSMHIIEEDKSFASHFILNGAKTHYANESWLDRNWSHRNWNK